MRAARRSSSPALALRRRPPGRRTRPRATTAAIPSTAPRTATCGSTAAPARCRSAPAGRSAGRARRCRTSARRSRPRSRVCRARTPRSRRSCSRAICRCRARSSRTRRRPRPKSRGCNCRTMPTSTRSMTFIEKVWRRLVEMIVDLQKDMHEEVMTAARGSQSPVAALSAITSVAPDVIATATLVVETAGPGFTEITRDVARFVAEAGRDGRRAAPLSAAHLGLAGHPGECRSRRAAPTWSTALERLAPADAGWVHDVEGPDDMPAHVKTMLTGVSLHVPVDRRRARARHLAGHLCRRASRAPAPARDRAAVHRQRHLRQSIWLVLSGPKLSSSPERAVRRYLPMGYAMISVSTLTVAGRSTG